MSFDYERDRNYYYLMKAWDANSAFEFVFSDYTSKEIKSDSVSVVKAALARKIGTATHTLVLVGKDANRIHPDSRLIGYRNWQCFEIAKSYEFGNKLIAVKLGSSFTFPEELYGKGASIAYSFTQEAIISALEKAY